MSTELTAEDRAEMERWDAFREAHPDLTEIAIAGGRRCAIRLSEWLGNWWVGTSPRNGDNASVEGGWEDWVTLARKIIEIEDAGGPLAFFAATPDQEDQ